MRKFILKASLLCSLAVAPFAQAHASEETFPQWISAFRQEAAAAGISQSTINAALSDVKYLPRVIELDRKQPEGTMTFAQYRKKIVSDIRISQGREMITKHKDLLNRVAQQYGVQPQYIVALWGIETSYGKITGGFQIVDSLATLAHDGRRGEFFKSELLNALKIIDGGHISASSMKGSWAGAMGQSQFMPSSFLSFAEDFNKDGRRDIWGTQEDVFASIANYLSKSGWQGDERWGRLVSVPKTIDQNVLGRKTKLTLQQWNDLGVRQIGGQQLPQVENMRASLVAPDGFPGGPIYLTYGNYDVIMKWNRSTYFATSVGLLADQLASSF
jgi:membrane-bound lytic murein transglycosylase B